MRNCMSSEEMLVVGFFCSNRNGHEAPDAMLTLSLTPLAVLQVLASCQPLFPILQNVMEQISTAPPALQARLRDRNPTRILDKLNSYC